MTEDQIEQFAIARLSELGYAYQHGPGIAHDGEQRKGTSMNLAPAASPLRVDPSGGCVFLTHTSLLLGRRLRSSILSSSRLVWIKNTYPCHPFEVHRSTLKRASYEQVLLMGRLREAVRRINPKIPTAAQEEAVKQVARIASPELLVNNEVFRRFARQARTSRLWNC